jgi:hypothetical protein
VADANTDYVELVLAGTDPSALTLPQPIASDPVGRIGTELASDIRLAVDTGVDADTLARVLAVVGR